MWSRFLYLGNNIGQADLPDTSNMFSKSTKNVLEAFENFFSSKHEVLSEDSNPWFDFCFFPMYWAETSFKYL